MARGWKDKKRPAHAGPCRNVKDLDFYRLNVGKTLKAMMRSAF